MTKGKYGKIGEEALVKCVDLTPLYFDPSIFSGRASYLIGIMSPGSPRLPAVHHVFWIILCLARDSVCDQNGGFDATAICATHSNRRNIHIPNMGLLRHTT